MYNEQNKSAKMTIDEPDTPWASPPRELFEDPLEDAGDGKSDGKSFGGPEAPPDMDDVANRLRDVDATMHGAGDLGTADASHAARTRDASRNTSEWDSSDDEAEARGERNPKLSFPDPGSGTADARCRDEYGEPGDFEAHDEADRELKARLFEAQRKSHQCTFRGVMAKGKAMLDEEDE
jgi:hypothetical protein